MTSRRTFCSAVCALPVLSLVSGYARAADDDIQLMGAELTRKPDDIAPGLYLSVNWEFDLDRALTESLRRGIALYFVCEFRLQRARWYWVDKDITTCELVQRLSFSPLSRQYRLSSGGLTQSFDSLEQVLPLIKQIRDWRVADLNVIDDIDEFEAETRMRLDTSRLPRPLQVTIGGNSDWLLESNWEKIHLDASLTSR